MADASIDVVFRTPGLSKADKGIGGLDKKAKKLEKTEKSLNKTENKVSKDFLKNEEKKKKAINKTIAAQKKANAEAKKAGVTRRREVKQETARVRGTSRGGLGAGTAAVAATAAVATQRRQQVLQAIAKIGGSGGAALGAAGEGVGVGGGIGLLGAAAGAAAFAIVALSGAATRASESVNRISEFGKTLRDTISGLRDQQRAAGLAFGQAQGSNILKLASRFSDEEFREIDFSARRTGDQGQRAAIVRAQESGLIDRVGLKPLLDIIERGARIGQNADEVINRLASLSPGQLAARAQQGTLIQKALGFESRGDLFRGLRSVTDSGVLAVQRAAEQRVLERDKSEQDQGFFLQGRGNTQLRLDLVRLIDVEQTAANQQDKQMQEQIDLLVKLNKVQSGTLEFFQKGAGGILGLTSTQEIEKQLADQNISRLER